MADEYAKVDSMLNEAEAFDEEAAIAASIAQNSEKRSLASRLLGKGANGVKNMGNAVKNGAVNAGSKVAAGGMSVVQSASITGMTGIVGITTAIAMIFGSAYKTEYRDDYIPPSKYECLDEYADTWKGVFGTINETPLAEQNSAIVERLKEINEWSKCYVAQSIPDSLLCQEKGCAWYQREGCPNGDHAVKKVANTTYTYIDSGAKIDLANVRRIHDFFSAYGLIDVQIAAICGVMTIESRIDFTSVEGYNIQGERYNLDPSAKVTTDGKTYGFKPWAEGLGDDTPITVATCMHQIKENQDSYGGDDKPINYSEYSDKYTNIWKLGIGLVGFTDGDGFHNNTLLRNYADYLNDKVNLIQNIVEGSRGWREELRQRAADTYHIAYGAENEDTRGTATDYKEKVDKNQFLYYYNAETGVDNTSELEEDFDSWGDREWKSSGWLYKEAAKKYKEAAEALQAAVDAYNAAVDDYVNDVNYLRSASPHHVNITEKPDGAPMNKVNFSDYKLPEGDDEGDIDKYVTDYQTDSEKHEDYKEDRHPNDQYVSTCKVLPDEQLYEMHRAEFVPEDKYHEQYWLEYKPDPEYAEDAERRNNIDVVYPHANPTFTETPLNPAHGVTATLICPGGGGGASIPHPGDPPDKVDPPSSGMPPHPYDSMTLEAFYNRYGSRPTELPIPPSPKPAGMPTDTYTQLWDNYYARQREIEEYDIHYNNTVENVAWQEAWNAYYKYLDDLRVYNEKLLAWQAAQQSGGGGDCPDPAEHNSLQTTISGLPAKEQKVQQLYDDMMQKKEEFDKTLEDFNKWSEAHAHDVVKFYNALQDYYTASMFDMEAKIRDASLTKTTIFYDKAFFSKAAYEYEFVPVITELKDGDDAEPILFRDVFEELIDGTETEEEIAELDKKLEEEGKELGPTTQKLRLYYELWQNYAKYATNLPQSGKYINWWTPEVQLLFMVGGSYDEEKGQGIRVRKEYREVEGCDQCKGALENLKRDNAGETFYNWMSTWKGDNYTGRDLTTATKNYYYDMVSGGFDDGTLELRTQYAYAYYYMFQYNSPYQQAINYASVGGEASKIMDEMIAEGRWQTNSSNTLSDTAMPHNDKWKEFQEKLNYTDFIDEDVMRTPFSEELIIKRQWEIDSSTTLSRSVLSILGEKQSSSRVNLLTDVQNGCKYTNIIDNATIANSALYLVDDPLIYDKNNEFTKAKYGDDPPDPVSNLLKTVHTLVQKRLNEGDKKSLIQKTIEPDATKYNNDIDFIRLCVLWSGQDIEFENIQNRKALKEYLHEASSSIWQDEEEYQKDEDPEKKVGRGNSKIWEQRRLGPYYDKSGKPYWVYKWYLVPRVLDDGDKVGPTKYYKWYDDMRNDPDAERGFGDTDEDYDKYESHEVNEHYTNNAPSTQKPPAPSTQEAQDVNGYKRKVNEDNQKLADWIRVDWECWDKECKICEGRGGHGDFNSLCQGDIIIADHVKDAEGGDTDAVYIWLGEEAVQSMFPLEAENAGTDKALVMAGGSNPQKLKTVKDTGFEWSPPSKCYGDHDTPCEKHDGLSNLPKTPEKSGMGEDDAEETCQIYNPKGKWTVYRLVTTNYTDTYRSAGVTYSLASDANDLETWYKFRYKGMYTYADDLEYLAMVRKKLGLDINTDFDRDKRYH